jgi:hypothetical protein
MIKEFDVYVTWQEFGWVAEVRTADLQAKSGHAAGPRQAVDHVARAIGSSGKIRFVRRGHYKLFVREQDLMIRTEAA